MQQASIALCGIDPWDDIISTETMISPGSGHGISGSCAAGDETST